MAILLAVLASTLIGSGEFVASGASRRMPPEQVTVGIFLVGAALAPLLLVAFPSELALDDLLLGAVAGVGNGLGMMMLYRGYAVSSVGVVAPLAGVIMAVIPVLFDVVVGDGVPSGLTVLGIVLGLVAVGLTSYSPGLGGDVTTGARFAVLAGVGYGVTLTTIGLTERDSGMWPVVPQRLVALVVVVVVARRIGRVVPASRRDMGAPFLAGVLGSAGLASFVAAAQRGSLGPVAVAGSQFAAVAVLLAFVLRGERVRWWQSVGLVGAGGALALIALG